MEIKVQKLKSSLSPVLWVLMLVLCNQGVTLAPLMIYRPFGALNSARSRSPAALQIVTCLDASIYQKFSIVNRVRLKNY